MNSTKLALFAVIALIQTGSLAHAKTSSSELVKQAVKQAQPVLQ